MPERGAAKLASRSGKRLVKCLQLQAIHIEDTWRYQKATHGRRVADGNQPKPNTRPVQGGTCHEIRYPTRSAAEARSIFIHRSARGGEALLEHLQQRRVFERGCDAFLVVELFVHCQIKIGGLAPTGCAHVTRGKTS